MYKIMLNDDELYQVKEAIKEQIEDVVNRLSGCSDVDAADIEHTLQNVLRQIEAKEKSNGEEGQF